MRSIILLLTLVTLFILGYLYLDRKLFYYGKNSFDIYSTLPLKIIPEERPDFEGGFVLKDQYGFTIAGNGNTYKLDDKIVLITSVLSYCVDERSVTVNIKDEKNETYFIKFSSNPSDKGSEIIGTVLPKSKPFTYYESCFDITDKKVIQNLVSLRLFLKALLFLSILVMLYLLIKIKQQ